MTTEHDEGAEGAAGRAFIMAAAQPWAMTREALETVFTVADRMGDPSALMTRGGKALDGTNTVTMRDGVAVIPVVGPIFRYANLFTAISGATSTQILARDIQAAVDNPYVRGIVLDINSPGGEVAGINELGNLIHAARARKPIVAYGGAMVASGAYWLASQATEIVIDATALVGSIGIVTGYTDTTERDAKLGMRRVEIVSSNAPNKRVDPTTDEGRAQVQETVDALEVVFMAAVARGRGVSVETVAADFGRGGVFVGTAAVEAGTADRVGSLETVITELAGSASKTRTGANTMANNTTAAVTVSNTAELRAAVAAGHSVDNITVADNSAAVAAARAEGEQAGRQAATTSAATAERERVLAIQALAEPGFEAEVTAAINDGSTPEAFALTMMRAAKDRGVTLGAMRQDASKSAPAAANKPNDAAAPRASKPWASILKPGAAAPAK